MSDSSIKLTNIDLTAKLDTFKAKSVAFLLVLNFLLVVLLIVVSLFSMKIYGDYKKDDHITFVKTSPDGSWTVDRANVNESTWYQSTVDSVLYRLLGKCFSSINQSLVNDWSVCRVFLSSQLDKSFINRNYLVANKEVDIFKYIENLGKCANCPEIQANIVSHDHKNFIPNSFGGDARNDLYESIFYISLDDINSDISKRIVVSATWGFMSSDDLNSLDNKLDLNSINEILIENPLGIYFVNWLVIEDKNND